MITLFEAFLGQIEMFFIGASLFLLRHFLSGDKRSVAETFPDTFQNTYFILYLIVLWFGVLTWLSWYIQSPRYGIWSCLFAYSPLLAWIVIAIVAISTTTMILMNRYYSKD
jgi:hypothetical protein